MASAPPPSTVRVPELLPAQTASAQGDPRVSTTTGETFDLWKMVGSTSVQFPSCLCVVVCEDTAAVPHSGVKAQLKRKEKERESETERETERARKEREKERRGRGRGRGRE